MLQFVRISVQMLRRKFVIRPHDRTLKQTPYALYAVGVNVPAHPFLFRMVHGFMTCIRVLYAFVVNVVICVDCFARGVGILFNKLSELKPLAVRDNFQSDLSAALNRTDYRSFIISLESSSPAVNASADVCLVNLDNPLQLFCCDFSHNSADSMTGPPKVEIELTGSAYAVRVEHELKVPDPVRVDQFHMDR